MSDSSTPKQEFVFQAEIRQLLHLLAHSLYQSKEIAIRELISNASDALDKMRFLSLTDEKHRETGPLEIRLDIDEKEKTIAIRDNGIGMTHDELVANLGTIAHSGSLDFLKNLTGDEKKDVSLIGQFGVGFYSAFMLADTVRVRTRSHAESSGWEWLSDGTGKFSVEPAEVAQRGTSIILALKDDCKDLAAPYRLREVIKKYSSFVAHPIFVDDKQVNTVRPIWVEPKSKLTDDDYSGFYSHLTHRTDEKPLWRLHVAADSPIQFHAILFCPPSNPELLGLYRMEHGLHLCAKRILVQSDNKQILPEYLRFLVGLVDSEDLPLNVSRETLQDSGVFRKIRSTLVKKVLDRIQQLQLDDPAEYKTFFRLFGTVLKEGIGVDFEHRERIAKLLLFASTAAVGNDDRTTLDEYIARCGEKQKKIYYLGGPDLNALRQSPNLEIFKKRGIEVLLLTDPVDEFAMPALRDFSGKEIVSIDAAELELPDGIEPADAKADLPPGGFGKLLESFRTALGDRVQDVRESKRLSDSPCCLVNPDGAMSAQMQKLMKFANRDFDVGKRILEVNPQAKLIAKLSSLALNPEHDRFVAACAEQLYSNALLLEGAIERPEAAAARILQFMEQAAESKSPLIL